jgi:hypothetical protein
MLKFKKLFLILPVFIFGFLSCSKDDSTPVAEVYSIEGKWQFTKEGTITNNQEVLTNYQHTSGCTKDYTEILAGNVIKDHYFDNPNCQETIDTGTWSRSNNSFVIYHSGQPDINTEIMELTSTTLKVKFVLSGITNVLIFTRI